MKDNTCKYIALHNKTQPVKQPYMKGIGYMEHDRRNNTQLKTLLQKQPVSIAVYTTGMYAAYKSGIMTEDFLKCSYISREVNHGVVLVGYGTVD